MRWLLTLSAAAAVLLGAVWARGEASTYLVGAGYLALQDGRPDDALRWLDRAVWLDGPSVDIASVRAPALLARGDSLRAMAAYQQLLRVPRPPGRRRQRLRPPGPRPGGRHDGPGGPPRHDLGPVPHGLHPGHPGPLPRPRRPRRPRPRRARRGRPAGPAPPTGTDAQIYLERARTHDRLGQADRAAADFATAVRLAPGWGYAHWGSAPGSTPTGGTGPRCTSPRKP